jgi:hypothetical protein
LSRVEAVLTNLGPGILSGITFGRWLKVLQENRFAVDLPYWGRAAMSLEGYMKNVFPELRVELREQIAREWRQCFDAWCYRV